MPLTEVVIDGRTWADAKEPRRAEWSSLVRELLDDNTFSCSDERMRLELGLSEQLTALDLRSVDSGELVAHAEVSRDALAKHVAEYIDVVRQLSSESLHPARVEALDMGKKVVHDNAARALVRLCRPLGADHATCRRLFSLLLALRIDTTRILGIHGHRPIR